MSPRQRTDPMTPSIEALLYQWSAWHRQYRDVSGIEQQLRENLVKEEADRVARGEARKFTPDEIDRLSIGVLYEERLAEMVARGAMSGLH
jgi:hypothetical protein